MRKVLSVVAMIAALGLIVGLSVVAFAQDAGPSPSSAVAVTTESPSPSPEGNDVKGNCDEAEHADDPECQGVSPDVEDDNADEIGEDDNSGPSENSGPGSADDQDGADDDNSGPSENSGPGSGDDDQHEDD